MINSLYFLYYQFYIFNLYNIIKDESKQFQAI